MSYRITRATLKNDLETLSKLSKRSYVIEGAYGKFNLRDVLTRESITGYCAKRELHDNIWSIIKYIWREQS